MYVARRTALFLLVFVIFACTTKQDAPRAQTRDTQSSASKTEAAATKPGKQPSSVAEAAEQERTRCSQGDDSGCIAAADRIRLDAAASPQALQQALLLYQSSCDHRVADGCAGLGAMLQDGLGTPQNLSRALSLYRQSCDARSGRGCSRLGVLYIAGHGVARDVAQASGFLLAGCELDDGLGCMNLGVMYQRGDGVPADAARAHELFTKACLLHEGGGCRQLGEMYASGFAGQTPNPKLSMMFAQKACSLGDAVGCSNAGMNHQVGFGTEQDPAKAARAYRRACELGDSRACELIERFAPPTAPAPH